MTVWLLMQTLLLSFAAGDVATRGTWPGASCDCVVVVGDPAGTHVRLGGCRLRLESVEVALGPLSLRIRVSLPGMSGRAAGTGMLD